MTWYIQETVLVFYQASGFTGFSDSYAVPAGVAEPLFSGSVGLILSIGITQQVFDTLSTALKCINFRPKLLILLNIYINQQVMNSYVFTYHGNGVRAIHRSVADTVSLSDALSSVGFRCIGLPWNTDANPRLEANRSDKDRPRIQVVDDVYL